VTCLGPWTPAFAGVTREWFAPWASVNDEWLVYGPSIRYLGPMIEVRDLSKSFGGIHAVRDVSFTARDGEITGIIGPNGAGKTTILRLIYTVLAPDSGRTLVDGIDARLDRRSVQRRIGVLPDVRGLYPRLTGREHIAYFGALHGITGELLQKRIASLARAVMM
jgi:sodium transport system ATP-binding protein